MTRRTSLVLTLAAALALPVFAADTGTSTPASPAAPAAAASGPYNEQADARADINQAIAQATAQRKQVLVVYGANWCKDCLALDRSFHQGGLLSKEVDKRYVTVKVDVGRFNRNVDVATQMGVSLKKGIPTVAVLGTDGQLRGATLGGELANARGMGEEAVLQVLAQVGKH